MANSSFFKNTGTSSQIQSSIGTSSVTATNAAAAASNSATAAATSATAAATSATSASSSAAAASASSSSASTSATSSSTASSNAQDWAVKTTGLVDSTDYASKAWAIGGTGVTASSGASKEWATQLGSTVDGSEYSAKHYAQEAATDAAQVATDAAQVASDRIQTGQDATNTAASQVAAAASAAAAAATLSSFDDRYYGAHASDSAAQTYITGEGLTVDTGDLYFNNTDDLMKVYDGSAWIAASSAGSASLINFNYTATASQTTFSGSDDNSRTLSYTVDNLIVTRNGVVLEDGTDYTATNGTSIVLAVAATAGDEINVVAFESFTTADMVSATNGGAFQGNVDFAAGIDVTGNVTVSGTVDGRDVAADGTKLDGIEAGADVTDAANVAAAGAAMLTGANFTGNVDVTGTGTMDRLGLGAAAHASAALLLSTTNQHIRLENGGELGIIELESNGDLNIWAHGDGETINLKTGSGAGADVLSVVGNNVGIGTVSPDETVQVFQAAGSGNNYNEGTLKVGGQTTALGFQFGYHTIGSGRNVITSLNNSGGANQRISIGFGAVNGGGEPATNVMTLNQAGAVGIGITTPDSEPRLHVRKGDAGGVNSATNSVLTIENNTTAILQFLTPNTANQQIRFGDPQDTGAGFIQYNHSANAIQFGTNGPEKMRLDVNGNLLLNTTSTSYGGQLTARQTTGITLAAVACVNTGSSGTRRLIDFFTGTSTTRKGSIESDGTNTSYNTSSDYRLKENVTAEWDATTRLKQLNPVRFNFIENADKTVDGFLAHEVQTVVPEAITGEKDAMVDEEYEVTPAVLDDDGNEVTPAVMGTRSVPDYQGIDQSKLVPLLVKTIQELEARITALETA